MSRSGDGWSRGERATLTSGGQVRNDGAHLERQKTLITERKEEAIQGDCTKSFISRI